MDLIDRQNAIDAIEEVTSSMSVCLTTDEYYGMTRMKGMAIGVLIALPPAQPETPCYLGSPCEYQNPDVKMLSAQSETCAYWDRESNICALHRPSAQPEVDCQKCVFCGFAGFKQFQTAQPDVPDRNVGDIISILSDIRSKYNCLDAAERPYYHALSEAINALSEQPEIIRCKDCKHWEYDVIFADGWCRGKQQGNPEWYCADAERRTNETG